MATWSDFTLTGSTSGSGAGALTLSGVQENDLIVTAVACRGYNGEVPSIQLGGISASTIFDKNSAPYNGYYWGSRWNYRYPYYNYNWYYQYRYWYWWYGTPIVLAKVQVFRADEAGSVTIDFSEPSGVGTIFSTTLKVWHPNIAVGGSEAISELGFVESAKAATVSGYQASIDVGQDDLLLAMGVDNSANYASANISVSGPSTQELLDFFPTYANRSVRIKLWRVKTDATAALTYANCYIGRMAEKLTPNVHVVQTAYPTVTEDYAYIEFQPNLTAAGRIVRPRWFEALRTSQAYATNFGLRKRWMNQAAGVTENENGEPVTRARITEMWKIDKTLQGSVPVNEAYMYADEATAEDRVTALDLGW